MNKILIVVPEPSGASFLQEKLSYAGFYTAIVGSAADMLDFCRQHSPDLCLIDLDMEEERLWHAIQGVKALGDLANLPFVGITNTGGGDTLKRAKDHAFGGLVPKDIAPETLIQTIKSILMESAQDQLPAAASSSLNRLIELSTEVLAVAENLKGHVGEFGNEGPELFGYITTSGGDISKKLASISESDLTDKELRHDFRNLIGSVTGFSELILMEAGLSPDSHQGLTRLRECSREFVELLDRQKVVTTA